MLGRVLVVDDDSSIRSLTVEVLEDAGYDVRSAGDGQTAFDAVQVDAPELIVLDLQMPVMDGRAFFRLLRASGYSMPVLLLSAYGARTAMLELGAEAAIGKPFDIDELVGYASMLLAGAHSS